LTWIKGLDILKTENAYYIKWAGEICPGGVDKEVSI